MILEGWRCLRPGLFVHTAQALSAAHAQPYAQPVSTTIPNAKIPISKNIAWTFFEIEISFVNPLQKSEILVEITKKEIFAPLGAILTNYALINE